MLKKFEAPVNDHDSTSPFSSPLPMNDFILLRFIPQKVLSLSDLVHITPGADEELPSQLCFCTKVEVSHRVDATFSRQTTLDFVGTRTVDRRIQDLTDI